MIDYASAGLYALPGTADREELTAEELATLSLGAHGTVAPWEGYAVPVVTEAEFRRFISTWERNDANGTWDAHGVEVRTFHGIDASVLIYTDAEGNEPNMWHSVGSNASGNALYALAGWEWTRV